MKCEKDAEEVEPLRMAMAEQGKKYGNTPNGNRADLLESKQQHQMII